MCPYYFDLLNPEPISSLRRNILRLHFLLDHDFDARTKLACAHSIQTHSNIGLFVFFYAVVKVQKLYDAKHS